MRYYKLIDGQSIVGVATQLEFLRYQHKHGALIACEIDSAEYVYYKEILYRDVWLRPIINDEIQFLTVSIVEVDEEEYNALVEALETEEEIVIPDELEPEPEIHDDPDYTLEYVREMKVAAMNAACTQAIINGFDLELSDGETYHFSMELTDQVNLLSLASLLSTGATEIPYHANGELCRMYSAADFGAIVTAATNEKTWHTTYVNSLKSYINSLETIPEIAAIQYGMEIPAEYQSDILKALIAQEAE